jgi:MoxR-like ATPase
MAELRGHFVPAGGGEWRWMHGPAMRAFAHGGRLVLDEITRASDDCLSFCLALLDDPESARITLPADEDAGGGTFTPHPDYTVWATTNDSVSAPSFTPARMAM